MKIVLPLLLLVVGGWAAGPDVTDQLEDLGIPYAEVYPGGARTYARNPWDLHVFGGHLYLAAGNSSNLGPARNAGPVPVLRLDPATGEVSRVFQIDDEQIDLYYTFDNRLYIPGHDPKEGWELGNFYRLEADGQWVKHRTIPGAIHNYAMTVHHGRLYAGTGTIEKTDKGQRGRSAVCVSTDWGETWEETKLGHRRIHAFLHVGGGLYAVDVLMSKQRRQNWENYLGSPIQSVFAEGPDGAWTPREDLQIEQLFPGYPQLSWRFDTGKPVKPVAFGEAAVYIGGAVANDHQYFPVGLFVAESLAPDNIRVRRADLPPAAMPWDLLLEDGRLYVLASLNLHGEIVNVVYVSTDALTWSELFRFRTPTFARSFARLDGSWYIALGCRIANPQLWGLPELHPDTGRLLRLPATE